MKDIDLAAIHPELPSAFKSAIVPAAGEGDARSQCALAYFYGREVGEDSDYDAAFKWAKRAAEQGNAEGCYLVGYMYSERLSVPKNEKEAVKWLEPCCRAVTCSGS